MDSVSAIKSGGLAVIKTDTLYGLVSSALNKEAVERIYNIKNRDINKPLIILIPNIESLTLFGISLDEKKAKFLNRLWPNSVTVVLPCESDEFKYLHRGLGNLAFRVPKNTEILDLLNSTGPIVAPSANPEGEKPARNISEAKNYFGDKVDVYEDGGDCQNEPSTIISITGDSISLVREGKVPFLDIESIWIDK